MWSCWAATATWASCAARDRKTTLRLLPRWSASASPILPQIGELSGGQKKRVFLARALAQESRIILLDEPFTGVDAKTEYAVMELLKTLRSEGYLMLVSTHNLGAVPQYCNEVVLINRSIIAHGGIDDIYTVDNLERAFGSVLKNIGLGDVAPQVRIISDDEHPAVFVDNRNNSS